jgi:hypothetical protein
MKLRLVKDNMSPSLKRIDKNLHRVMPQAVKFWIQETPKDEGNAKRKTKLKGNIIHADYPYADRLDSGYSKQAPDGMSEPTTEFIIQKLKQIFRR